MPFVVSMRVRTAVVAVPPSTFAPHADTPDAGPTGKRKWLRRARNLLIGLTITLLLLIGFGPMIVAHSPLRHQIIPLIFPDYAGKVETGSAALNWFSPVELGDVTGYDQQSQPLLHVDRIRTQKTLFAILCDQDHIGEIELQRPTVSIRLTPDSSNFEQTLAGFFEPGAGAPLQYTIRVVDGSVNITAADGKRSLGLQDLQATFAQPYLLTDPMTLQLASVLHENDGTATVGTLKTDCEWRMGTDSARWGDGSIRVNLTDLHLSALEAPLSRVLADADLDGILVGDVQFDWNDINPAGSSVSLNSELSATRLAISVPQTLDGDTLRAEFLTSQVHAEFTPETVHLEKTGLQTDVATLNADGTLSLSKLQQMQSPEDWLRWLVNCDLQADAKVDLARLANMLPHTLHLRPGLKLTGGELTANIRPAVNAAQQPIWSANVEAKGLQAELDGQTLSLNEPIELQTVVRDADTGPSLDRLLCRTGFCLLDGKGTADEMLVNFDADLARMQAQLGQFIDMTNWNCAGTVRSRLTLARKSPTQWSAEIAALAEQLSVQLPGQPAFREPRLTIAAKADIDTPAGTAATLMEHAVVSNGELKLLAGNDELTIQQVVPTAQQPLADAGLTPAEREARAALAGVLPYNAAPVATSNALAAKVAIRGELASWSARLQPFVDVSDWPLQGTIDAGGQVTSLENHVQFEQFVMDIRNLQLNATSLQLQQRQVRLTGDGTWDGDAQQLTLSPLQFESDALALQTNQLTARFPATGLPAINGRVAFRGDIATVHRLLQPDRLPALNANRTQLTLTEYRGQANGTADLKLTNGVTAADLDITIDQPALVDVQFTPVATPDGRMTWDPRSGRDSIVFSEPQLRLAARGEYSPSADSLSLSQAQVVSSAIQLQTAGRLNDISTQCNADLAGQLTCDFDRLSPALKTYLGENIAITGRSTKPFLLRGPLIPQLPGATVSPQLASTVTVGWTGLQAFGLAGGPADLTAQLDQGVLRIGRLNQSIGTGRLSFAGTLPLNAPTQILTVEAGSGVENLALSPELCSQWLRFVAPVVADSAQVQGQFSLAVGESTVPLADAAGTQAVGTLSIASAQLTPGPLLEQLVGVVSQVKALANGQPGGQVINPQRAIVQLPQQNVAFQVANRQVAHQGLQMIIANVPIQTSGRVGFDDTIALTAQLPVSEKWIGNNKYLAGLKGQTLQIPITGTFTKPTIDPRFMQELFRRIAGSAAQNLLQNEVQKQIEKNLPGGLGNVLRPDNTPANGGLPNGLQQELNKGLEGLFRRSR